MRAKRSRCPVVSRPIAVRQRPTVARHPQSSSRTGEVRVPGLASINSGSLASPEELAVRESNVRSWRTWGCPKQGPSTAATPYTDNGDGSKSVQHIHFFSLHPQFTELLAWEGRFVARIQRMLEAGNPISSFSLESNRWT